ncbi:MAG: class I SAM-dependent methyltransferase [Nitrospiraceae bacterium]
MHRKLKEFTRTLRIPLHLLHARRRIAEFHKRPRSIEETVEWAMHLGSKGWFKMKTVQIFSEIASLARAVAQLRPGNILEIGTARGGTLFIWSQLASMRVVSCDLKHAGVRTHLYRAFPPPRSTCRVYVLTGDSHDPEFRERVVQTFEGEPVDFLFVDGDHTEAGVEADYEDYHDLVRPGGLIAFHDIMERQPFPNNQVYHFWRRLKEKAATAEFVADPNQCGFGIGVVRVPGG